MELKEIPVKDIERSPFQQRKTFNESKLQALADNIAVNGIGLVQPIKVRLIGNGKYQLVAGERRLRATILAKKEWIHALVDDITDAQSAAQSLAENNHREGLDPISKAKGVVELYKLLLVEDLGEITTQEDIITRVNSVEAKLRTGYALNHKEQAFSRVSKKIGSSLSNQRHLLAGLTLTPEQQEIVVNLEYRKEVIESISAIKDEDIRDKVVVGLKEVAESFDTQLDVIRAIKADPEIANLLTVVPPKDVELTHEQILDMEQKVERARELEVEQEDYEASEQGKEQARLIKNWVAHTKLLEGTAHEPFCPKCGKDKTHLRWVCCNLQLAPDAGMLAKKAAQLHTNMVVADLLQDRLDYEDSKKEGAMKT
jgi:ParB family chromosome partitioning protein